MLKIISANSVWQKMRGLITRAELKAGEALLIPNCRQIHTWFMRYAIDVIFLDKNNFAVKIIPSLPPWRVSPYYRGASAALELKSGEARRLGIKIGGKLF